MQLANVALLALAVALLAAGAPTRASSYLDDYFLPTAKLALNKLQQSLGPAASSPPPPPQEAAGPPTSSAEDAPSRESQTSTASAASSEAPTALPPSEPPATGAPEVRATSDEPPAGGDSVRLEPAGSAPAGAGAEELPKVEPASVELAKVEPLEAGPAPSRDPEAEAVAAVEASMAFSVAAGASGPDSSLAADPCYDEFGHARFCEPDFENAAFERPVRASSECGRPPSRFCTAFAEGERREQVRNCHMCDAAHPKRRHPAAFLTDLHVPGAPTCWVSAPLGANRSGEARDNVTLALELDKKFELTYVALQFCAPRPDSLAVYKSADFGLTWQPLHFVSSHCRRVYGLAPGREQSGEPAAACVENAPAGSRVAFAALGEARQDADKWRDWATATNLRLVLDRAGPGWPHAPNASQPTGEDGGLTAPSEAASYALADLSVGARCKCNGHASRCAPGQDGRLRCECRHNTAGRDCQRCAPFHFDRPWQRASPADAGPCQPCNCNGHSRKCRFDAELYRLSGRRSGGVCTECRDNTAGRHCHYCKEGFTRDHTRAMSDKEACKHCDCHPIGSLGRVCNQTTGQCPCKEGVTGPQCTRCAPGYQQSSSPSEPCIPVALDNEIGEPSVAAAEDEPAEYAPPKSNSVLLDDDEPEPDAELEPAGRKQLRAKPRGRTSGARHPNQIDLDALDEFSFEAAGYSRPLYNFRPQPHAELAALEPGDDLLVDGRDDLAGAHLAGAYPAAYQSAAGRSRARKPQVSGAKCSECQAAARKLAFRRFCQLDFALKATVLSWHVQSDWTRLELTLLDVFKSPARSTADAAAAQNLILSEPGEERNASAPMRLRAGSAHVLWAPTEDLACKCPRLRLRATYLLLGSMDAKEGSLQLDRHSVALEWRPSLQDRLAKYQRRAARGKCRKGTENTR